MGIEKLIFCGDNIPIGRRMTKTSRSTEKYVPYEIHESITSLIKSYASYQLIALEITNESKDFRTISLVCLNINIIISDDFL